MDEIQDNANQQQPMIEEWDEQKAERKLQKSLYRFIYFFGCLFSLFQLIAVSLITLAPWRLRSAHLLFACILTFILFKGSKKASEDTLSFPDVFWILCSFIPVAWIWLDYEDLLYRVGVEPSTLDIIMGCIIFLVIIEAGRRLQGLILPFICTIMLFYALFGGYVPGVLGHRGFSLPITISYLFSQDAIFGQPLGASSTYIMLFVLFGAFLKNSGVGKFFIDFAFALTGWMRGGPAKVAVVASSLFGTVSGSASSNVVTTGVLTIPLMKSLGYRPAAAGAIEAVASTGGQLMPPVMGAVAFVMSEMTGVPYLQICKVALLPALFFYTAVFLQVDYRARNLGLVGMPKEALPSLKEILLKSGHLVIPVLVLVYFLIIVGTSPIRAAIFSLLAAIAVSWIKKETRMNVKEILGSLYGGAKSILPVAIPCAEAGIIVGVFNLTGLGLKLSNIIISYSGGNLMAALLLTAVVCIILGIGLPTIPSYIICAVATVPALLKLGVPEVAAHLFILYFAVISTITPPVGNTYYAAAGIAESEPQITGILACRLGVVAYIIPFMFVYYPPLIAQGSLPEVLFAVFFTTLCVFALAKGFEDKRYNLLERLLFLATAGVLTNPYWLLHYFGIGFFFLLIIRRRLWVLLGKGRL